jgi:DNA modification methylase
MLHEIAAVLSGLRRWCVVEGDCLDVLPTMPDRCIEHVITDPPYGEHIHRSGIRLTARGQIKRRRNTRALPDVSEFACRRTRSVDLGFVSLTSELRAKVAIDCRRLATRWSLIFSDMEGAHEWRADLEAAGLQFVRYGVWVKDRAMPQITGDRPGSRVEQITIAHPTGRKRWSGGGLGNVWQHPVVANCSGHRTDRIHTAQKPIGLMLELVDLFTDPGDVILDPFAGSGTTGVAAIRLGRRSILIERDPTYAALCRDRMSAEEQDSELKERRGGQLTLSEWGGGALGPR